MLVKLKLVKNKLKEYNKTVNELNKMHPDLHFREIFELDDIFIPYTQASAAINSRYIPIAEDSMKGFKGVYICHLNSNHDLERVTNYKEVTNFDSPIYWHNYGVADNASQVLDRFESLRKSYPEYMNKRKFVILMTPIFKEDEPENGGWRWHKWGRYIGNFDKRHEYLYDEEGIDYVYVFSIVEVVAD